MDKAFGAPRHARQTCRIEYLTSLHWQDTSVPDEAHGPLCSRQIVRLVQKIVMMSPVRRPMRLTGRTRVTSSATTRSIRSEILLPSRAFSFSFELKT